MTMVYPTGQLLGGGVGGGGESKGLETGWEGQWANRITWVSWLLKVDLDRLDIPQIGRTSVAFS